MPHRTTLWRRGAGRVSTSQKAGRKCADGDDLQEVYEILDFWRLTNLLSLWYRLEWQTGNPSQTIQRRDFNYWIAVMLDIARGPSKDTSLSLTLVAFCDVAMTRKQVRNYTRGSGTQSVDVPRRKRLEARFKKDRYSVRELNTALKSFDSDPDSPWWDAVLTNEDSFTVTNPFGNKVNEGETVLRLKTGRCATHRIFPRISRRMDAYWRRHPAYSRTVAYFERMRDSPPTPKNITPELSKLVKIRMANCLTEYLIKLKEAEIAKLRLRLKGKSSNTSQPRNA
jgi:hypothetical protein